MSHQPAAFSPARRARPPARRPARRDVAGRYSAVVNEVDDLRGGQSGIDSGDVERRPDGLRGLHDEQLAVTAPDLDLSVVPGLLKHFRKPLPGVGKAVDLHAGNSRTARPIVRAARASAPSSVSSDAPSVRAAWST